MVSRVNMLMGAQTRSTSDLLRDYRETSVASSRGSSDITEPEPDNTGVVAMSTVTGHNMVKTGSLSSLGTRSVVTPVTRAVQIMLQMMINYTSDVIGVDPSLSL